jgi:hypothetical protein
MVISLGPAERNRSRRRLRDCSRLSTSASHRLCRPVRRLLQGGLPFSPRPVARTVLVAVALAPARPVRQSGLSAALPPPWLSPGTPLCAARTFLWLSRRTSDHPSSSRHAPRIRLSKYSPRRVARAEVLVPKGRFELPRPYGHYALNVARLPVPPLRHAPTCSTHGGAGTGEYSKAISARQPPRKAAKERCNGADLPPRPTLPVPNSGAGRAVAPTRRAQRPSRASG